MVKILPLITKYWYIVVIIVLMAVVYLKKKKVTVTEEESSKVANEVLNDLRIRDEGAKAHFRAVALQIAENLGTAYNYWDPRSWSENDDKVYELISPLTQSDFNVVSKLYFEIYAKGSDLSTDLAKNLDAKLYALLKIK
jgi:hypothetical protein